jgi:Protein of unknown function (DUF3570)
LQLIANGMFHHRALALTVFALLLPTIRPAGAAPRNATDDSEECIAQTTALLEREGLASTHVQRASCEEALGRFVEALRDLQEALEGAAAARDAPVAKTARARLNRLAPRIPQVTLTPPTDAADLAVTFDGDPVPPDRLGGPFSANPGRHAIHAEGTKSGLALAFDTAIDLRERAVMTVPIVLTPSSSGNLSTDQLRCVLSAKSEEDAARCIVSGAASPARAKFLTSGQLRCLLVAKSEEEVARCLPKKSANLAVKVGFEISGYTDTTAVNVLSPAVIGSVASPTAGWNVGGSYLVDVVSAASPDIVSEASPPFHEIRQAGTLGGGYKPGLYGVQLSGNVSNEPDYLSIGGGLALTADLNDKLTTPRIAFNYSHDTIGRSTTPFSVFHHNLDTSEIEAGCTFVMSPRSILLVSGTLQIERGDQSKPYRYVAMFDPVTAGNVKPGQSYASVNAARESIRPLEQLPLERDRYAGGARFAQRLGISTLRLEERLYYDSWQQAATTTDLRFMTDLTDRLRVWPHLRFNLQNAVSFYRLAYSVNVNPGTNQIAVPAFRTGDREDSPMAAVTGGAGVRYALTGSTGSPQLALTLQADVLYSKYFQSLYITSRTAVYGTLGIDAEFE